MNYLLGHVPHSATVGPPELIRASRASARCGGRRARRSEPSGWTRERGGGLRDLGTRVLLRGTARARALRGRGADTGRGAGAWPEGPLRGAPAPRQAASVESVRTSSTHRWSRRGRLGALPDRTGGQRSQARDEVDRPALTSVTASRKKAARRTRKR